MLGARSSATIKAMRSRYGARLRRSRHLTLRDLRRRLKKTAAEQTAHSDQALGILVCEEALAAAGAKTYGVRAILLDPAGTVIHRGRNQVFSPHFRSDLHAEMVVLNAFEEQFPRVKSMRGASPGAKTWHIAKYGYGPYLDGLFLQSNCGIVTRLGVWLMPRPPAIRTFFFLFPDDEDLGDIIELIRPLKMNNVVQSLMKVTSDLYGIGTVITYPFDRTQGKRRCRTVSAVSFRKSTELARGAFPELSTAHRMRPLNP